MKNDSVNFQGIFYDLVGIFEQSEVQPLLIGGFAVNHYGFTRATLDIDFLLAVDDLAALKGKMIAAGYTNFSLHDNVAFFQRPGSGIRIDFVQTDRETMRAMLDRALPAKIFKNGITVPCLEDLLAMKLFSIKFGSWERREKDTSDVVHLCVLNDISPAPILHELCLKYADESVYTRLCERIELLERMEK